MLRGGLRTSHASGTIVDSYSTFYHLLVVSWRLKQQGNCTKLSPLGL